LSEIKYGSKVQIRDNSALDGLQGVVIKVVNPRAVDVLLGKEILWPAKVEDLELVS
jgi:hypothetical protein